MFLKNLPRHLRIRPLTGRLLAYMVLLTLVLSLLSTGYQVYAEYRQEKQRLHDGQRQATTMVGRTVAGQLWTLNLEDMEDTMEAALTLSGVSYIEVESNDRVFSVGERPEERVLSHRQPLISTPHADGSEVHLGEVRAYASYQPLFNDLVARATVTLGYQTMVLFLGALGFLIIVRFALTRHLETMSDYARRLNLDALIAPLDLERSEKIRTDELSDLESALNTMRLRLLADARSLKRAESRSQNERDQAVRANQAKNLFVANISHELRTPLQSVMGFAGLLEDTELDDEQREYLHNIRTAAESLSSIINDLLDISRMEAGKLSLDRLPFNLNDIVDDVIAMQEPHARAKGLTLERRGASDLPPCLLGDPVRLRQVLLNLTSNAIQYTDSGHVLISVETLQRQNDQTRLRISVEDTGIGIASEDMGLILEPYIQLSEEPHRHTPGAGLGLAICHQLVELMGGELAVDSTPGAGSTFWVTLTLPMDEPGHAITAPDTTALAGKRILVVDSYPLSRKITLELLNRSDITLTAVDTGREAMDQLAESRDTGLMWDVIIMDGFLPDMSADHFCQFIRQSLEFAGTRILALSSNPQRGDAEHFREMGADAFLTKALRESYLLPMLQQLLSPGSENKFLTRFSLATVPPVPAPQSPVFENAAVLLVEDHPVNRKLTKRQLEKLGCTVTQVSDGRQAINAWEESEFDAVLMDCMLPEVDGFEATRTIRDREATSGRTHTPIIALTASAREEDEENCRLAGMDDFIAKPVRADTLSRVLEKYIHSAALDN